MTTIDATTTEYALHARFTDGSEGLVPYSDLVWEELTGEIASRVSLTLPDAELETGARLADLIGLGSQVTLLARWADMLDLEEVARGVVEEFTPNDGLGGTFSAVAYDPIRALLANKIDAWYAAGMTPAQLMGDLASTWNIPIVAGTLDQSELASVTLAAQAIRGQSLADCILKWLQAAFEKGMPRLEACSNKGALEIRKPGRNAIVYWIRQGESNLRVSESFSIVNLVTRVVVLGSAPTEGAAPVLASLDGATDFGIRQDILYLQGNNTTDEVETAARHVLEEKGRPRHDRTLESLDVPGLHKFDRIRVSGGTRDGYQIAESITHQAGVGTMQVLLGNVAKTPLDAKFTMAETASSANPEEDAWDTTLEGRNASDGELYALALRAGWSGEDAVLAVAVSLAENHSSNPRVVGGPNYDGSYDIGLWQINELRWGDQFGGREALFNARINAGAAYHVWTIQGWNAWTTYKKGLHQAYMDRARAAAAHPSSPTWSTEQKKPSSNTAPGTTDTTWQPQDVRGQLPVYTGPGAQPWETRNLGGVTGVDLHYTAGAPSQTAQEVAAYQISGAAIPQTGAGVPFYSLAYHLFVESGGQVKLANGLDQRTWHNAGANHNATHVSVCFAGNGAPNDAQVQGIGRAIAWCERQLGRQLTVQGHRDSYATLCPGAAWPTWKPAVLAAAGRVA